MFTTAAMLPLVARLGEFLRAAGDHAKRHIDAGVAAAPEVVAAALEKEMVGWTPVIAGRYVMDDPTRRAAARFLAGVAVNMVINRKEP